MSILHVFQFKSKEVHCHGTWDKPIWVAQEICDCLDLQGDAGQHTRRLDDDEKVLISIQTPGGTQDALGVTEPGLYSLVLGCRKPVAKQFKRWLTHDVIPSIRKTGSYSLSEPQQPASKVQEAIEGAKAMVKYLEEMGIEKTIAQLMSLDAIAQSHPELKPMCEPAKKLLSASATHQSVGMTATQVGKRFEPKLKPTEVNEILESLGFQFKQPKKKRGKDSYQWQLTEEGKEYGFVYFATQSDKWSGDQIRWQDSVIAVIQDCLDSKAT